MIGPNFIFIHINRTGGTSIERILKGYGGTQVIGKHDTLSDIIQHKGLSFLDDRFVFSIVRNPWNKMVSLYSVLTQQKRIDIDFNQWICSIHKAPSKYTSNQLDWLMYNQLVIGNTYRFENLHHSWLEISKILNIEEKLPYRHQSKHEHYSEYYNQDTKDIVGQLFHKDIEYFNYKFNE